LIDLIEIAAKVPFTTTGTEEIQEKRGRQIERSCTVVAVTPVEVSTSCRGEMTDPAQADEEEPTVWKVLRVIGWLRNLNVSVPRSQQHYLRKRSQLSIQVVRKAR